MDLWTIHRESAKQYAEKFNLKWVPDRRPWEVPCDIAVPTATQNEIEGPDAENLVKNGCIAVCEGANMPSSPEAIDVFMQNNVAFGPGKAVNAGGVAVSGLEMSQNSMRLNWSREEVDEKLHKIMRDIHTAVITAADKYGSPGNYVNGANIAGFLKVANAMMDQGIV